ncbi:bifunctional 3'-5' exonuclease/DNA polymerase [Spongisporangium articulatum]|uniref:DNA-directed DNA polymerase n=1 Tax=Spongisporangium articulatum TaxID=3362603 RepID=A0ABW8AJD8_9ACTN
MRAGAYVEVGAVAGGWAVRHGAGLEQVDDAGLVALAARLEGAAGPLDASPRWVWASTAAVYPVLLRGGVRVRRCHDLGLTEALLSWHAGVAPPGAAFGEVGADRADVVQAQLFEATAAGPDGPDLSEQLGRVEAARAVSPGFPMLVAAESAAALAAAEMGFVGLPWRADAHDALLTQLLGPRPRWGRPAVLQSLAETIAATLEAPRLNVDSPVELLKALHRAGIPVETTRAHELKWHEHAVVEPLLQYKELARLHVAHGWAWRDQWVRDGRFHPEYVPGGVVSGRWATRGGGALQIPRAVRGAVVADAGWKLVMADAGQLEPRVLAALSRDPGMVAATRAGDLYTEIATRALGRADARAEAKLALLSAMYGGGGGSGAAGLAALRRRFPAALALLEDAARRGEDGLTVRSVLGRTCPPPGEGWQSAPEPVALARSRARGRFTRNFVIQASAADWANALVAGLRLRLAGLGRAHGRADLVFFQHDEVIVHAPETLAEEVVSAVTEAGEEATRLVLGDVGVHVPLQAVVADSYAEKG